MGGCRSHAKWATPLPEGESFGKDRERVKDDHRSRYIIPNYEGQRMADANKVIMGEESRISVWGAMMQKEK